jgi:hypothetical protein
MAARNGSGRGGQGETGQTAPAGPFGRAPPVAPKLRVGVVGPVGADIEEPTGPMRVPGQERALADVVREFGEPTAHEVKRGLKKHGSRFYDLSIGELRRTGRFCWYEAGGHPFRTRRYALTADGVFALRDEHEGLAQMFALHTPLLPAWRDELVAVAHHFVDEHAWLGGARPLREMSVKPPRIVNGVLALELIKGDEDEGHARHVMIALATGAVTVTEGVSWRAAVEPEYMPFDDDDRTEHIATHDPDKTQDDGLADEE